MVRGGGGGAQNILAISACGVTNVVSRVSLLPSSRSFNQIEGGSKKWPNCKIWDLSFYGLIVRPHIKKFKHEPELQLELKSVIKDVKRLALSMSDQTQTVTH